MDKVKEAHSLCKQLNDAAGMLAVKPHIIINGIIMAKESLGKLSHY